WLAKELGRLGGLVVLLVLGGSVLAWPSTWRAKLLRTFHHAGGRAGWIPAARHAGLATHNDRTPRITAIQPVPAGELLRVRIPAGSLTPALAGHEEAHAARP